MKVSQAKLGCSKGIFSFSFCNYKNVNSITNNLLLLFNFIAKIFVSPLDNTGKSKLDLFCIIQFPYNFRTFPNFPKFPHRLSCVGFLPYRWFHIVHHTLRRTTKTFQNANDLSFENNSSHLKYFNMESPTTTTFFKLLLLLELALLQVLLLLFLSFCGFSY